MLLRAFVRSVSGSNPCCSGMRERYLSCCEVGYKYRPVAGGILSPEASCQLCPCVHLSTDTSNRSLPPGQIIALSLRKWQFDSQSNSRAHLESGPDSLSIKADAKKKRKEIYSNNINAPTSAVTDGSKMMEIWSVKWLQSDLRWQYREMVSHLSLIRADRGASHFLAFC